MGMIRLMGVRLLPEAESEVGEGEACFAPTGGWASMVSRIEAERSLTMGAVAMPRAERTPG